MTLTPLTNKQTPDNSILDFFNRQTYLGNTFILPQNGKSLTDTSAAPCILISNPSGSGKSLFLYSRKLSTDNNNVAFRFYLNAVPNVLGSTTVPVNCRSGYSALNTSIANCYLGATITSNGTFIATIPASVYTIVSEVMLILDPGSNLYLSAQQSASGTTTAFAEFCWYEI